VDDRLRAQEPGTIPVSVFVLYARTNYLSFGAAPAFLKDDENVLFSYFGVLLRSVIKSLVEADKERRLFFEAHGQGYNPVNKARGEA